MKSLSLAGVIALAFVLGGCHWFAQLTGNVATLCLREDALHSPYMAFIAPRRPADRVAKAVAFHEKTQKLCAAGAQIAEIVNAMNAADAARAQ